MASMQGYYCGTLRALPEQIVLDGVLLACHVRIVHFDRGVNRFAMPEAQCPNYIYLQVILIDVYACLEL